MLLYFHVKEKKGGKSVFDHGALLVNVISVSGFLTLFDVNVSLEMFLF